MYLKTLSVAGFKSFADRTRLNFEPGVNVVVGPNGSGKSNLVDAVAWVLGTQAASLLRTAKMDEVIFSGTASRPPTGKAEVSLTFDNESGQLPLDLPEVTITRRLFRDGTSDYEINGAGCRLLDIQELLADSGVGRHQHVIVGQGRIGTILNARPDEHRAVIEEAAGVVKHRGRRDRSLRRLEQTDLDVARLHDILGEQQRRMRPLKRQASAAERQAAFKDEAKALRLYLGGEDLRRIRGRLSQIEAASAGHGQRVAEATSQLTETRDSLGQLETGAGEAGRALERDTAAAARLETAVERLHRVALVARERRSSLASQLQGAGDRRNDLVGEREHLTAAAAESRAEEQQTRVLTERREAALRALEDEERALAEQAQLPPEGVAASLRGNLSALEAAAERDRREAEAVNQRIAVVTDRIVDETQQADRIREEIKMLDIEHGTLQGEYRRIKTDRGQAQQEWEAAEAARQEALVALAAAGARLETLDAAAAGVLDPAARRHVEDASEVVGALSNAFAVPEELAPAVDAALAEWSEAMVATDRKGAEAVVSSLKAAGLGGVPLVAGGGDRGPCTAREVAAEWGFEALVDRIDVAADPALAARLFGDVVLVEGWAAGWGLIGRHPEVRVVTPEGDLITAAGIRPAVPDGAGPVAREAARADLEAAEIAVARAESMHTTTKRAFDTVRGDERTALERVEQIEARMAGSTEALAVVGRSASEGEAELARLGDRKSAIDDATATRQERLSDVRRRIDEFAGEEAARQAAWEDLSRRRHEVAGRRDEARQALQQSAAVLAAVEERIRITADRLAVIDSQMGDMAEAPADPAEIDRLEAVERFARRGVEICRSHIDALRERQRRLREEAGTAGSQLREAHELERSLEREIADLREKTSALSVEQAELRVRDESVCEGLRRDADATEDEALAAARPEIEPGVDMRSRLDEIDGRLRRMGPVNPLAAAEYKELEERARFLEEQLADLEESRRDLRKVIAALDEKIGEQFKTAFAEIAGYYAENFALLFPGGRGMLKMTEPDDPLNTGVEIGAQPHGKKVMRLALLSGGERSLAALAFLFAVFRARPSPFYFLDEVEAALDDANLHRFIRLLGTMRGSAQLAIVTHQQQTMEAADILYGVTMEPGQSSKVVAKRLSDVRV